jgi:hypothetical protein
MRDLIVSIGARAQESRVLERRLVKFFTKRGYTDGRHRHAMQLSVSLRNALECET